MPALSFAKLETAEGVARLVLARPRHNVLHIPMMQELCGVLERLRADRGLKAIVLAAEGPSFCAGVEVADHRPSQVEEMIAVFNRLLEGIEHQEVPTIAAVHGACLGGGMEAAIACDIVIAAKSAVFGQPEVKLGFFPPYAAVRLPVLVGPARAIEICTTGRRYAADEAARLGFVTHCVEDEALPSAVEALLGELKQASPLILRLNKLAVKRHLGLSPKNALAGVSDLFLNTLMKTEDTLEGIASFEEKRKPIWKNR